MTEHAALQMKNPGWGDAYPRILYRTGESLDHMHVDAPLKIGGLFECETRIVADEAEEEDALAEGWATSPDPATAAKEDRARSLLTEKDDEIAALRAQLAAQQAPRNGRPPNAKLPEVTNGDAA